MPDATVISVTRFSRLHQSLSKSIRVKSLCKESDIAHVTECYGEFGPELGPTYNSGLKITDRTRRNRTDGLFGSVALNKSHVIQ